MRIVKKNPACFKVAQLFFIFFEQRHSINVYREAKTTGESENY